MKGAIEVLRNIRMLCENNPCSHCPLDNKCPGVMAPIQWSDEMISIMVNIPPQEEGELYEA